MQVTKISPINFNGGKSSFLKNINHSPVKESIDAQLRAIRELDAQAAKAGYFPFDSMIGAVKRDGIEKAVDSKKQEFFCETTLIGKIV